LNKQNLGARTLEADNAAFGELTAIKTEIIGASAVGKGIRVEDVCVEMGNLEIELSSRRVPVERKKALDVMHPHGLRRDGGQFSRWCLCV
jgi:hypothetical protein